MDGLKQGCALCITPLTTQKDDAREGLYGFQSITGSSEHTSWLEFSLHLRIFALHQVKLTFDFVTLTTYALCVPSILMLRNQGFGVVNQKKKKTVAQTFETPPFGKGRTILHENRYFLLDVSYLVNEIHKPISSFT
jgi:hypothetical protein